MTFGLWLRVFCLLKLNRIKPIETRGYTHCSAPLEQTIENVCGLQAGRWDNKIRKRRTQRFFVHGGWSRIVIPVLTPQFDQLHCKTQLEFLNYLSFTSVVNCGGWMFGGSTELSPLHVNTTSAILLIRLLWTCLGAVACFCSVLIRKPLVFL